MTGLIIPTLFILLFFPIGFLALEGFIWLASQAINESVDYMLDHEKDILNTIKTRENKNLFIKKIKSKIEKENKQK